ncbi:MAG: ATP phosphoribosyltransferase regulatory subunit [Lachnospiraceae bacterium]|nr:ATP phosphoribosyltransferase regulatory subunit [Lachnospiraceae bacterium]
MEYYSYDNSYSLLHTPDGVRDIYNGECELKLHLQNKIHHVLHLYGFRDIQTPSFEFFDIFNKERGTIPSREMYKFFDREGNTLVLRPDFTPSIGRCAAKYFKDEELPVRLCYIGNTFINNSSHQGKLNETTQVGAELFNDASVEADAEIVALTIDSLLLAGLKEFQIEIGHGGFVNSLLEEANFTNEEAMELKMLLEQKNLFGIDDIVSKKDMNENTKELLLALPEMFGSIEHLQTAKAKTNNPKALAVIKRLEELYTIIDGYGLANYLSFDLGMLSRYNYYTGIILRGVTYGTGEIIAQGGRYDNLVGQFGKESPAIGVAFVVDALMQAVSRQKIKTWSEETSVLVLYDADLHMDAVNVVKTLRQNQIQAQLLRKKDDYNVEDYVTFAKGNAITEILNLTGKESAERITDITLDSKPVQKNGNTDEMMTLCINEAKRKENE